MDTAWQTSTSSKVTRMALNLWNHSIMYDSEEDLEKEHISSAYAPSEIFCCSYAPYFWEAIKIRYPEYTRYQNSNRELKIHENYGIRNKQQLEDDEEIEEFY